MQFTWSVRRGHSVSARVVALLVTALGTAGPAAHAQSARALSLADAVRMAEAQSPTLRVARATVQRAEGQQAQARSQLLPQVSATSSYTRTLRSQYQGVFDSSPIDTTKPPAPPAPCDQYLRDETATTAERLAGLEMANRCSLGGNPFSSLSSLPFGQKNLYNIGLNFSQALYAGGRISAQNDVAEASRRSADIEVTAQTAQLTLDVTQAYYDAALSDRLVSIAESTLVQAESTLRQVQANRTVGSASEFELLRAQVTRDNQRPILIQRQSDRQVAYLRLKQLLNMPLETPVTLTSAIDDTTSLPPGVTATDWTNPDTTTQNRATVRQTEESMRMQEGLLRVTRSARLPSFNVISQYGKVAYPLGTLPGWSDFRDNWTVGLSGSFSVYTGGRQRGDELVAKANLSEARARLEQTKQFASLDTRVAINNLRQAEAAWTASSGVVEQAQRAHAIAEVRYREGLSTQLELSDARLLLQQALANRAQAARNLQVARVRLALLPRLPLAGTNTTQQNQTLLQQLQQQQQQEYQRQQQQQQQQSGGAGQPMQFGGGVQ
jgi:outer membrane protein